MWEYILKKRKKEICPVKSKIHNKDCVIVKNTQRMEKKKPDGEKFTETKLSKGARNIQ